MMRPTTNQMSPWLSCCMLLPLLVPTALGGYNMINCQADIWCYQPSVEFNGQQEPVCYNIDVLQPNYHERGVLQTVNYARLFTTEWETEYGRTFDAGCFETPLHPLWELRGATSYGHFLSVMRRDCSTTIVYDHDTCTDWCTPDGETSTLYTPFQGCSPSDRKDGFQLNGLKIGSFEAITGNRYIQFNSEAICGSNFPCTDLGHCGTVFKQQRFILGVGRAMETAAESNPSTYLQGTRTYEFTRGGITPSEATDLQFWQAYADTDLLHRIPSGSHYDKCKLFNSCTADGEWSTMRYQFTYAHHTDAFDANTAVVVIDGTSYSMTTKHSYSASGLLSTYQWAIFEYETSWPAVNTCSKYHFEIQSGGVTYRLPEDTNLEFATTGNGCEVNHYTDGSENCPGESLTPPARAQGTAVTNPPTAAPGQPGNDGNEPPPCFSPNVSAHVKGKGVVKMPKLKVGDEVLTGTGQYETIYAIDHVDSRKATKFVQMHYEGATNSADAEPLEMTAKHMVFLDRSHIPVPAASVQVGDQLHTLYGPRLVTKIDHIIDYGIYSPLAVGGTMVVNDGIIASSYSALVGPKESNRSWVEIAGVRIMSQQSFFDMILKPYQLICTSISLDLCQLTTNEKVAYSELGGNILHFWSKTNNAALQSTMLLLFIAVFAMLSFLILSPYGIILCISVLITRLNHSIRIPNKAKEL